jgi:F420-dependent oxidoreductase-like protein
VRLGLMMNTGGAELAELIGQARAAADAGLDSVYLNQITSWDALTVIAVTGREVPAIALGTAVVPTYPRHPVALAVQALSTQAAVDGRLILGVGPSHAPLIEGAYGYSFGRPARHVREYLTALMPLLRGEPVDFHGETLTASAQIDIPVSRPPSVLLSALGPTMLRIAGELADGTVTVWAGPADIAGRITPTVTRAAADAGRPAPRIVAIVPISVTDDPERVRHEVEARLGSASQLASYQTQLAREGRAGVHETLVAGDEALVLDTIRRFAEAGVTELVASPFGDAVDHARTMELLAVARQEL